jgi:hypothetical protein
MMENMLKMVSTFAVPKGSVYFVPEVELRRTYAPDGTLLREEYVYWAKGAAVAINCGESVLDPIVPKPGNGPESEALSR